MENDVRTKKIPIVLDKPRNLVVDLNVFADLEEIYGSHEAGLEAIKSGSFKAARTFLWLCLRHEDETLTEKQVGAMVNTDNIQKLADIIEDLLPKKN